MRLPVNTQSNLLPTHSFWMYGGLTSVPDFHRLRKLLLRSSCSAASRPSSSMLSSSLSVLLFVAPPAIFVEQLDARFRGDNEKEEFHACTCIIHGGLHEIGGSLPEIGDGSTKATTAAVVIPLRHPWGSAVTDLRR